MKSESPEHVLNYPRDFGSMEETEASSLQQKEKEDWPAMESDTSWSTSWSKLSAEENDSLSSSSSAPDYDSDGPDWSTFAMYCSSFVKEVDHEKEEEIIRKFFNYKLRIRERTTPLVQPESYIVEDLEEYVPGILQRNPGLNKDAPPEPYATLCIMDHIHYERRIFNLHKFYKAVKCLYENIPYVTRCDSIEEIRKKIDLTSEPFSHLDDVTFHNAVDKYKGLLKHRERLFHPLIRKSFKNEFFSLVDIEEKLGERNFLKLDRGRKYPELRLERVFQEISRAKGLRDEHYEWCCEQIELQEEFDGHLLVCQKIKPDSSIEDLTGDEDVVTKKFKKLDPELILISLKASIKSHQWFEQHTQWYTTYLKLLKEEHSKKETGDVDKMLIDFCNQFPCIFDFPLDKALDSAMEERFKDIIDMMKEKWFPDVADYYVIEVTLLYMKSIYFEGRYEPSWPTAYHDVASFFDIMRRSRFAHEHPIYERVFSVDYKLA